jgi:hypothetical protein
VIEEARRRSLARRRRSTVTLLLALLAVGGVVWALSGGYSRAQSPRVASSADAAAARASAGGSPRWGVRISPTLEVGRAGWCVIVVERGVTGGSACGGVLAGSALFLQVYGWGQVGSHRTTQVAVAAPGVQAVRAGTRRVSTSALPGLPYGMRAVRVETATNTQLVPLGAGGQTIPTTWPQQARQATVRRWQAPARAPLGACSVTAGGVERLTPEGGAVAVAVRPFPGALIGSAFLPCAATTFRRGGVPVTVTVLLDAAQPGAPPASLPDFHAVRSDPGVFSQGGLVATRDGAAWLVVSQGSSVAERLEVLAHVGAKVSVGAAPASSLAG